MAFPFKLERPDGAPAEPASIVLGVYVWRPGDQIPLGGRSLRVVGVRDQGDDQPTVLVVEDAAE